MGSVCLKPRQETEAGGRSPGAPCLPTSLLYLNVGSGLTEEPHKRHHSLQRASDYSLQDLGLLCVAPSRAELRIDRREHCLLGQLGTGF